MDPEEKVKGQKAVVEHVFFLLISLYKEEVFM